MRTLRKNMTEQTQSRYLEYLPAIYHEHPFLGQFLVPFEEVLSSVDRYFAPALTDANFLPWLANWVALALDEEWDETKRRQLISEAVELYQSRGTVYGLKRYLEIYAGLVPEIQEWSWPGGMQIGVASQIGGTTPEDASLARIESMTQRQPPEYDNYYVVDTIDEDGEPQQLYYNTDQVERVDINDDGSVDIWLFSPGGHSIQVRHQPATITRRDQLVDDLYTLTNEAEGETQIVQYRGNTFLVDEVELPYRFIVDVRVPLEDLDNVKLDKVRSIIDLEKPAHTMYYLKLTPVVSEYVLQPMQIGVRSTIGLDTIAG